VSLEIYDQYGFKFFLCNADKTPDTKGSWMDERNHISREQAEKYQNTGRMIGAWIPEDVVVLDLDRHEGKPDGVEEFNRIKSQYDVQTIAFQSDTYCVRTKSGGFHVFFYARGHQFRQGAKAPGIDLKTHAGYVIAAGSPGYLEISDAEPMELPETLSLWLADCQKGAQAEGKQPAAEQKHDLLPVAQLRRILKKIDAAHFRDNGRWIRFVMSIKAACGDTAEVRQAIVDWSSTDSEYTGQERQTLTRIDSTGQEGGITIGTFIAFMQEEDLSDHLVKKVIRFDKMNTILVEAERREIKLPFEEPDYEELSCLSEAGAFYNYQGNSAAAVLLAEALRGRVIFVEGEEKRYFYFDGNRWSRLSDIYQVVYTVLYRIAKRKHAEKDSGNEMIGTVLSELNSTQWKSNTAKEFAVKTGIFHETIRWDSVSIKETITAADGVLDFSTRELKVRKGLPEEYRRSHVPYTIAEIMGAGYPERYIEFLADIFPDPDTCRAARFASSLCISGNAMWRTFQIWVGEGSNGKSTWIDVIKKTLGEEKAKNYEVKILLERKFDSLGTTPELAHFEGAYAMFGIEVDPGKRFQSGIIKNLTGGDDITINPKYQHERDIKATWQLIFACNDLPTFDGNDPAMINRLVILPFRMRYYKDSDDLEEIRRKGVEEKFIKKAGDRDRLIGEMLKERAGIIRLMIDDYIELVTRHTGAIPQSEECKQEKLNYREQNDILGEFVRSMCEINDVRPDYFETLTDLAAAYSEFAGVKTVSSTFITRQLLKYDKRLDKTTRRVHRDGKHTNARGLQFIHLRTFDTEIEPETHEAEPRESGEPETLPF
jgi:phage/plasmid-associated DNA primase